METSSQIPREWTSAGLLLVGTSALAALMTSALAWTSLPYEQLERFTASERFLLWEGVIWMLALALGMLGVSMVLQVVGWRVHDGLFELKRRLSEPFADNPIVVTSAVAPWWMIAYSLFLITVATAARAAAVL